MVGAIGGRPMCPQNFLKQINRLRGMMEVYQNTLPRIFTNTPLEDTPAPTLTACPNNHISPPEINKKK